MTLDIYQKLRRQLDQYSIGFPATKSGIEIDILNGMFSKDEAFLFTNLSVELEAPEAVAILETARAAGLITRPASSQKPFTMCNCCSDCCGFVRAVVTSTDNPADYLGSNYQIRCHTDLCTGCGLCVDACQTGAMKLNENDRCEVIPKRCIGCGLCVNACGENALELVPKPENKHEVPPVKTPEQFSRMAKKRGLKEDDVSTIISFGF